MQALFDYFEDAEEMVYISDVDTNELIYMNRSLRERFANLDLRTDQQKKCYEVLQGRKTMCPFCNNKDLKEDSLLTWAHENPVLNESLIIKDRLLCSNGRRYRVEIAKTKEKSELEQMTRYFTKREAVLNECFQRLFSVCDPEEAMNQILAYLGERFSADRACIYEIYQDQTFSNTYEWCAPGIKSQKEILQDLPLSDISCWLQVFAQGQAVEIENLEDIREEYPATYSLVKPQNVHCLAEGAIYKEDTLVGFIGLDNPNREYISMLAQILKELGGYMASQFKRRDLYHKFNEMSYRDKLTGAYNQNAMVDHTKRVENCSSLGVVYCDINGLKQTNDTQGHDAGNQLIQECYHILERSLKTEWIYRIGGDEFVAIYYNGDEQTLKQGVEILRLAVMQSDCEISIGYAWSDTLPLDVEAIIRQADKMMYQEKRACYEASAAQSKRRSDFMAGLEACSPQEMQEAGAQARLQRFLSNTYCDIPFLLTMLSNDNNTSYFYFGDMQKNLFYVSDNMRKKFGFSSNIVPDLIHDWAARIHDQGLLKRFWNDVNSMLEKKQSCHDLRYQIEDSQGKSIWIRCFGKLKWSEDGTKPLFFAGWIIQQDAGFVVDSLTNFPTETVLIQQLNSIRENDQYCQVIGFSMNNISQINNNHGRSYGDNLVWEISTRLYQQFCNQLAFYRLSGMRCLALAEVKPKKEIEAIIGQMKQIIEETYQSMGISLQHPCSFALLSYPQKEISPQDFIENTVSLIKIAQSNPDCLYIDDLNNDIQQMQDLSNMELQLVQDIMNGMENFRIVIQPITSTKDDRPIGGETLLRWNFHGKPISPAVFIPLIEKEKMIHLVGRWVFERAVHACTRTLAYCPDFYLTVNVSLQQLSDSEFIPFIHETLEKYNLDGKHIVVELTESCMDEEPEKLVRFVDACTSMNMRIALDDFGSGYSSLRVLLKYPSNIIKLDRSLLLEMSDSEEKKNFISSIVYACHQFGKKVCMEGVESQFQDAIVKEAHCDMIQGFYYYRPMEEEQVYHMLAEKFGKRKA